MKIRLALVLWWFVAVSGVLAAEPSAIAEARRADHARMAAMMAGDGAALGRVFSDALVFAHSDGRVEGKVDYIKALLAGDTAYVDVKVSELQTVQPAADVVVLIGRQDMRKRLGPEWSTVTLRFLSVWRNESGTWRMVAWQSARPSGNSVAPKK